MLCIGNCDVVIGWLSSCVLDLVIMGWLLCVLVVVVEFIGLYLYVIVVLFDYLLVVVDFVMLQDLLVQIFLVCELGLGMCILMMWFLDCIGDGMLWCMVEMGMNEMIKQVVIVGFGIVLILQYIVIEELCSGCLVVLCVIGLLIQCSWFLLWCEDMVLFFVGQCIYDLIGQMQGSFLFVI